MDPKTPQQPPPDSNPDDTSKQPEPTAPDDNQAMELTDPTDKQVGP